MSDLLAAARNRTPVWHPQTAAAVLAEVTTRIQQLPRHTPVRQEGVFPPVMRERELGAWLLREDVLAVLGTAPTTPEQDAASKSVSAGGIGRETAPFADPAWRSLPTHDQEPLRCWACGAERAGWDSMNRPVCVDHVRHERELPTHDQEQP